MTIDAPDVSARLRKVDDLEIPPDYYLGKASMGEYRTQLYNVKPGDKDFVYTYGRRLREYPRRTKYYNGYQLLTNESSIDQIEYIIDTLTDNPASRRAVAVIWVPDEDSIREDVPCFNWLNARIIDGRLRLKATTRSWDIMGVPANIYGYTGLLLHIADELNKRGMSVRPGSLLIDAASLHAYQRDWTFLAAKVPGGMTWYREHVAVASVFNHRGAWA